MVFDTFVLHMHKSALFILSISPDFRPSPHQTSSPNSCPVHMLLSNVCDKLPELLYVGFFFFFFFLR